MDKNRFSITKKFKFEAAHRLHLDYDSPCNNFHGHSYKMYVTIKTNDLNSDGFIIDFMHLRVIQKWLDDNWDHTIMFGGFDPDIMKFIDGGLKKKTKYYVFADHKNVSAEIMCMHICEKFKPIIEPLMSGRKFDMKVRIYETENNFAEYEL